MIGLPLVEYECGCIGLAPDAEGRILMVQDSLGEDGLGLYEASDASHREKRFVPLAPERAVEITKDLSRLIEAGHRLNIVRQALHIGASYT